MRLHCSFRFLQQCLVYHDAVRDVLIDSVDFLRARVIEVKSVTGPIFQTSLEPQGRFHSELSYNWKFQLLESPAGFVQSRLSAATLSTLSPLGNFVAFVTPYEPFHGRGSVWFSICIYTRCHSLSECQPLEHVNYIFSSLLLFYFILKCGCLGELSVFVEVLLKISDRLVRRDLLGQKEGLYKSAMLYYQFCPVSIWARVVIVLYTVQLNCTIQHRILEQCQGRFNSTVQGAPHRDE